MKIAWTFTAFLSILDEKLDEMTLHETAVLNTSMLLTEIGDQMCWWQVKDVGDKSHYHYPEFDTNIKSQSPTSHSGVLKMLETD